MAAGIKAVALMSGGLDSALAARLVLEQGIEVIGLSCRHPFHPNPSPGSTPHCERVARELGIELVRPDVTGQMLAMLKNPPHGYGRHLNPCIDCRILYLTEGKRLMQTREAHFLVTGEVLGQRPMSQRSDAINIIDRDSGLKGLILRPLSARLLAPTVPEQKGWVDRERLLDISGRGRGRQLELAKSFGLKEFSAPAGGCLLTMEDFARKVADLLEHEGELRARDVELVKVGRQFRLSDGVRLAVGKNEKENDRLLQLAGKGDLVGETVDVPGPLGLLRGEPGDEELARAASIMARYVKGGSSVTIAWSEPGGSVKTRTEAGPMGAQGMEKYRI